jgi:Flp pilus assembly protein TadG
LPKIRIREASQNSARSTYKWHKSIFIFRGFVMYSRLSASRRSVVNSVKRFLKDRSGNMALITGLAALPVVLSAGVAIDMVRVNNEQTVFKAALDGAALAVGSDNRSAYEPDASKRATAEAALTEVANKWLQQNYNNAVGNPTAKVTLKPDGKGLEVTGNLKFPTTVMKLAGIDHLDTNSTSELTFAPKPMEIVLVLDTTGSMSAEIPALKKATYNFLRTLYGLPKNTSSSPVALTTAELNLTVDKREYVRLAVVPFAAAVRLNPQTPDILTWIDTTGANPLSTVNFSNTNLASGVTSLNNYTAWGTLNKAGGGKHVWNGCVEGRQRSNTASLDYLTNDQPPSAGATLFPAYFAPDGVTFGSSTSSYFSQSYKRDWNNSGNSSSINSTSARFYDPMFLADSNSSRYFYGSYMAPMTPYTANVPQTRIVSGQTLADKDMNNYPMTPPAGYPIRGGVPLTDVSGTPYVKHTVTASIPSKGTDASNLGWGASVEQRLTNTNKYFPSSTVTVPVESTSAHGPWANCAASAVVPLTHDPAKINSAIGLLAAYGGTNIMEGLAWGMRVISPTVPFTTVNDLPTIISPATNTSGNIAPFNGQQWSKIIILMSDGNNDPYAKLNDGTPVEYADTGASYNAYGRSTANVATNRNRYGTNVFADLDNVMDADTLKVCTYLKSQSVQLYTVGFGVDNQMLKQCATQPNAPYYQYESTSDLSAVFDHIGKDVLSKNIYLSK